MGPPEATLLLLVVVLQDLLLLQQLQGLALLCHLHMRQA
jgi:hypothetical protein